MTVLLLSYPIQDPAKPKNTNKRKERAADKVAQTEKAVAKARAEREKAKSSKSIEVNYPSDQGKEPLQQTDEAVLSLHSSDFCPIDACPRIKECRRGSQMMWWPR